MTDKVCPSCGVVLCKTRSLSDHRRFFALIKAAFDQWPEAHSFQPDSAEHLRAWLTCKAGHRNVTELHLPAEATGDMVRLFQFGTECAIKAAGGVGFVVPYRDSLVVISPKSISWDTISQKEFGPFRDAVSDVIEAETGIKVGDLLNEKAA